MSHDAFDFDDLKVRPLPPNAPLVQPPPDPFAPRKAKHPAKVGMLIATYLWICGLAGVLALGIYAPMHDMQCRLSYNNGHENEIIFGVIIGILFMGFCVTVLYAIVMAALAVWYFCTRQD